MGSVFVVVFAPSLQLFAGGAKSHEPMSVQALRVQLAVERFDEAVIGRFNGPEEVQGGCIGISPEVEVADQRRLQARPEDFRIDVDVPDGVVDVNPRQRLRIIPGVPPRRDSRGVLTIIRAARRA